MFNIRDDVIDFLIVVSLSPAEDTGEVIPSTQGEDPNVRGTLKFSEAEIIISLLMITSLYMHILQYAQIWRV